MLIGDPKQAIYAFRGADVYAYLDAAPAAAAKATLRVNWRSDQGLIDAYDALFADASSATRASPTAGPGRRCQPGVAADRRAEPAALRVRIAAPRRRARRTDGEGLCDASPRRARTSPTTWPPTWCGCLSSGAEVAERRRDGSEVAREPVRPGHVAVLVRTQPPSA